MHTLRSRAVFGLLALLLGTSGSAAAASKISDGQTLGLFAPCRAFGPYVEANDAGKLRAFLNVMLESGVDAIAPVLEIEGIQAETKELQAIVDQARGLEQDGPTVEKSQGAFPARLNLDVQRLSERLAKEPEHSLRLFDGSARARAHETGAVTRSHWLPRSDESVGIMLGETRSDSGSTRGVHLFAEYGEFISLRPNLILSAKQSINPQWTGIGSEYGLGYQAARQEPDQLAWRHLRPDGSAIEQRVQRQSSSGYYPLADLIVSFPHRYFGVGFGLGPAFVSHKTLTRVVEGLVSGSAAQFAGARVLSEQASSDSDFALNQTLMLRLLIVDFQLSRSSLGDEKFRNFSIGVKLPL